MGKKVAIIFLIIFVIILGFLSFVFIKNLNKSNEKSYVSELTNIGSEAYSEYYYKIISIDKKDEEIKAYLKKYEKIGLSFDLAALKGFAINQDKNEYLDLINEFLKSNKKCDENRSMVIVYPKDPFGSTDFEIEIKLNCDVK